MFPISSYSSSEIQGVCAQSLAPFQPFSLMFDVSKSHRLPSVGSNIDQRKWCRTTEIWRIGVNENVRQFFGQCKVNPRSLGWSEFHAVDPGFPVQFSGFYVSGFRRISWAEFPAIPESTSKDLPDSGIWIPYLIRSEISLPTWGEVVFHAFPMYNLCYQHTHCFHVIN